MRESTFLFPRNLQYIFFVRAKMSPLLRSRCRSWKTNCDRGNGKKEKRKGRRKRTICRLRIGGGENKYRGMGMRRLAWRNTKGKGQQQHFPSLFRPARQKRENVCCLFLFRSSARGATRSLSLPPIYVGGVNCYRTPPRRSVHQDRKMVGNKTSGHSRFISLRHLSRSIYGEAENRQENPTEICVFYPSPNGKTLSIFHSYSPLHHHIPLFFFISRWPASKTDRNIRQPAWQCRLSFYLKEIP